MRVCVCVCVCARARACACVRARASRCVHVRESACVRLPAEEDRRRFDTGAHVDAGKAALGQPWLSMIGLSCAPSLQETSQGGPGGGVSCLLDSSTGIRMKRCMPLKFYILAASLPGLLLAFGVRMAGFEVFSFSAHLVNFLPSADRSKLVGKRSTGCLSPPHPISCVALSKRCAACSLVDCCPEPALLMTT